jgi:glycosyltransferase involved in cell wall biosynthesis
MSQPAPANRHRPGSQGAPTRILFVALAPPFPPTNGHRMRNYVVLRALAEEGYRVSLVSFAERGEARAGAQRLGELCHEVTFVPLRRSGRGRGDQYWARLCALKSPYPYGVRRFASRALRRVLAAKLATGGFSAVICDGIYQVQNMPWSAPVPVLLSEQAVSHEALARYLKYESNPLKRAYGWIEYRKVRRWELRACASVAGVIACSPRERELLRRLCPAARIAVVPNCVDTESYVPVADDDGDSVLFIGALDWLPNRDAVGFLVSEILPRLREVAPRATLVVAGRNPSAELHSRLAQIAGLRFLGAVADTRPLLARAAAFVAPLRIGSGTRIKILEAGAMARSIVSTTLGAEGLDLSDGEELVLADEPRQFAGAVAALLADRGRRRRLGGAARRRVVKDYSLPALRRALGGALAELC